MIKGIRLGGTGRTLSYLDTLVVPIIENTPDEEDLKDSMAEVRSSIISTSIYGYLLAPMTNNARAGYDKLP